MAFNVDEFLSSQLAAPLATQFEVCPEGEFAMLLDSDPKQLQPREISGTSEKTGKPYHFFQLELNCLVQDEKVKAKLGRDRVPVRLRVNLDIGTDNRLESGPNKNVALGQLLEAVGANKAGAGLTAILGAGPFMGKVKHTSDRRDTNRKYAEVDRVTKLR